jgi:hypothetical protein
MIVVPDYRGHRIEVAAAPIDGGRFNAVVRIRRTLSEAKHHVETVTCLKVNATLAEQAGERWAKRWLAVHRAAPGAGVRRLPWL